LHWALAEGQECASGWHVGALWTQHFVRYYLREAEKLRARKLAAPQLGPSLGLRHLSWSLPVFGGDTLTFTSWAERKIDLPSTEDWGLLIGGGEVVNQKGAVVLSFFAQLLLERRRRLP